MSAPVLPTDTWALLSEKNIIDMLKATSQIPDTSQLALMKTDLFTDQFTKSGTTATVGMFGYNEFYFFYMKFFPSSSIIANGNNIHVWFQMGDTASPW